jgi:non-heme chloroperoxidase
MLKTDQHSAGVDADVFAQMQQSLRDDRPHFLTDFGKQFYGATLLSNPVSQETLQWTANMACLGSLKATLDCVTAFGKTDFRKDCQAFTIPTLIIHGASDKTVPADIGGRAAAKLIPQAVYQEYEDAPHGLFITHKERLNRDLIKFLESSADSFLNTRRESSEVSFKVSKSHYS